jgi:predicted DNA-binding antitoxin AbrB/MazE fold protein
MSNVIEAVYEDGVLKPSQANGLKEHQRYRLTYEETQPTSWAQEVRDNPELMTEIGHRVTILPDGRRVIRFTGALAACLADFPDDIDPVAEALAELRRERERHFQEELDELFPLENES